MREFFKGWRRKVGCVTLVLACIVTTGWFRSVFIQDKVRTRFIGCMNILESTSGYVEWSCIWDTAESGRPKEFFFDWASLVLESSPDGANFVQLAGFHFDERPLVRSKRIRKLWMPYWSIVLPLTLLSAWLLLSKQRVPAPKHKAEPAPSTGA